jgi:hypothetical protein
MKRSKNLRETATKEQGIFAPDGSIPAHEMLGDIFSDMGQPEQALAEYAAKVKLSPSRFNSLYGAGQNAEMAKHRDQGGRLLRATREALRRGNSTRPEIAHAQAFVSTVAKQN